MIFLAYERNRVKAENPRAPGSAKLSYGWVVFVTGVYNFGQGFNYALGIVPSTTKDLEAARRDKAVSGFAVDEESL